MLFRSEQGRTLVTVAVLSGGPFFSSDDLDSLPAERLRLLDNPEVLELVGGPAAVPDWEPNSADSPPSVWRRGEEVVAVFNWTPAPREHTLGIPGGVEVRDIWLREALAAAGDSISLELPAHGVRLLRLSSA